MSLTGAENKALQALSGECCAEPESVPQAQKPKRRRTGSEPLGAAKRSTAQQKQQPMVLSLLDLPAGWEKSFSLSALKQVAARAANLEEGWQRIGSEHRAELVEALSTAAAAWRSFAESVLPFDAAVAKGQKKLKQSDPRRASVERVLAAAVLHQLEPQRAAARRVGQRGGGELGARTEGLARRRVGAWRHPRRQQGHMQPRVVHELVEHVVEHEKEQTSRAFL